MRYNEIHRHWVLSEHRVLRRLVSWRDWLWSPLGSQPPDWHPPHGSCRTRGAGRKPARPPAALLAAWCRRPPLAPPPPRLPAARVSGIPLSRCLAAPAVLLQGGPGLGPTAFFSRDCSHFGQPLSGLAAWTFRRRWLLCSAAVPAVAACGTHSLCPNSAAPSFPTSSSIVRAAVSRERNTFLKKKKERKRNTKIESNLGRKGPV